MAEVLSVKVEQLEAQAGTVALALGGIEVGGRAGGLAGELGVKADDGVEVTLGVSKLDGEEAWTVDSMFVGSMPAYANGVGARYLLTKQLTNADGIAALDAAAEGVAA